MDAKALAKSKRAHSLHHKKKHQPHQASKAPSTGSDDKKATGKKAKEGPPQPDGRQANEKTPKSRAARPLPSNWGQYDEDFDLSSEEAQTSSGQPTEIVVAKSKGADYACLISEAKAQSQAHYSSDVSPVFDDLMNDFTQDFGPMLAAKGQSMLSWIADDCFEFEGEASTSFEAPFLSLNLNALADQLAKAKLSERLYLERDLLPLELLDDELRACGEDKHDPQTSTSAADAKLGASSVRCSQEVSKNVKQQVPSSTTVTGDIPVQTSEKGLKPVKQNKDEIFLSQGTDRSISPEPIAEHVVDSTSGKPPIFEAASAEAELDMLLSSFSETKVLESPSPSSTGIPSIAAVTGETVKKGTHMMESAVIPAIIDDDIDNLLEETSNLTMIDGERLSHGLKANTDTISSTMHPHSKPKLLDDFDSWLDTI